MLGLINFGFTIVMVCEDEIPGRIARIVFLITGLIFCILVCVCKLIEVDGNMKADDYFFWWRVSSRIMTGGQIGAILFSGGLQGLVCEVAAMRDNLRENLGGSRGGRWVYVKKTEFNAQIDASCLRA